MPEKIVEGVFLVFPAAVSHKPKVKMAPACVLWREREGSGGKRDMKMKHEPTSTSMNHTVSTVAACNKCQERKLTSENEC